MTLLYEDLRQSDRGAVASFSWAGAFWLTLAVASTHTFVSHREPRGGACEVDVSLNCHRAPIHDVGGGGGT